MYLNNIANLKVDLFLTPPEEKNAVEKRKLHTNLNYKGRAPLTHIYLCSHARTLSRVKILYLPDRFSGCDLVCDSNLVDLQNIPSCNQIPVLRMDRPKNGKISGCVCTHFINPL